MTSAVCRGQSGRWRSGQERHRRLIYLGAAFLAIVGWRFFRGRGKRDTQFKPQRLGESIKYLQGWIGHPAFQLRNVGSVDRRHQGQRFLRQVGFLPRGLDLFRQVLAQLIESLVFHAAQDGGDETFNPRNIIDNIFQVFIIGALWMFRLTGLPIRFPVVSLVT